MRHLFLAVSLLVVPATACLLDQRVGEPEDLPLGCRVDGECALGRVCEAGFCVPGCRDDADCPEAERCGDAHLCAAPE